MIAVIEPATEAVLEELPRAGIEEVDAAVENAKRAFPGWRAIAPADRASRLHALADALASARDELALLEARNAGKPIADARGEMDMVVATFRYYAGAPERLLGDTIPVAGGQAFTVREPLGVVALIVPWNFPLTIASWKLAPALAAGNTVVLKPAELTPLTALRFASIALDAGIPEGVVNVVVGPGSVCGQRLVEHPDVAKIAFTGSTEVGRSIAAGAAATIKRVTLELGGKSPTWCSPTPTSRRRPPPRRWPCSATPARTVARGRGSSSSDRCWTGSWTRSRTRSSRSGLATRWTRRRRWVR